MKKIFVLLILFIVFVISCGKAEDSSNDKVTLVVSSGERHDVMREMIDAANLPFEVEIMEYPGAEYEIKLKLAFGSKNVADIVAMDAPSIASYASLGVLEPLDAYWDKEDFDDLADASKQAVTWDGKIWSSPLNAATALLYYNKKVFEEHGIIAPTSVEDTWTWDELYEVCKKILKKDENGEVLMYAIQPNMQILSDRGEGMTYTQVYWIHASGATVLSPDSSTADGYFNSDKAKEGMRFYRKLFVEGLAPKEDILNMFETEKVAMWHTGPWMIAVWEKNFPEVSEWWGAMPMPKNERISTGAGSWNLSITAQSKNKDKAWQVIQIITGKEGSKKWGEDTGNIPARKSVIEADEKYNEYPYDIIKDQFLSHAVIRPVTPVYPQISEAIVDAFAALAYGEDVDKVADEAVEKMDAALSGY